MARNNSQSSAARRRHRWFGAFAAIFVLFMVLSGLAINHAPGLGFDQQRVESSILLDWYGLGEPEQFNSFAVDDDWLSFAGSQLYLNDRHVTTTTNGIGAVATTNMLIAAGSDELLLLSRTGELIERQAWGPSGAGLIEALGQLENGDAVIKSAHQIWLTDVGFLQWRPAEEPLTVSWSSAGPAPETLRQNILQHYRGRSLSFERLLLDFHSGRIFGTAGVIIYDLLALVLGFLAVSGLVLFLRGRRNGAGNGTQRKQD